MAHRIDIRFHRKVAPNDVHKVRSFIEDVWASAWKKGWVQLEELDARVNAVSDFGFTFAARESHDVTEWVARLVEKHFMESVVDVIHSKTAHG